MQECCHFKRVLIQHCKGFVEGRSIFMPKLDGSLVLVVASEIYAKLTSSKSLQNP